MKILQWNIGTPIYTLRGTDRQYFPYSLVHKRRVRHINEIIAKHDPDVLLLQEFLPNEIDLGKYPHQETIGSKRFHTLTGIFSKKPLEDVHTDELARFVSACIDGMCFASCHLYHFSAEIRAHQARELLDHIDTRHIVIMGDFNIAKIGSLFMNKRDRETFAAFTDQLNHAPLQHPITSIFPFELDHVFYSPGIHVQVEQPHSNFFKTLFFGMDHYPTIAIINPY